MEYPGLATIATRPERSGDSPEAGSADQPPWDALTKYDFIGSIIHEVGHNYLPMTVNTDEREWAWLDEGLVSFIEYRGEHSWEANFDVIYGEPRSVAGYLASDTHQPIMTSADSLGQKIANAYNKTASVLNMLRHLVLEPQEFDRALQQFATAWQGKRPIPGDFFRAMETAAGQDLSWFWRSWFFDAASVDFSVTGILQNDMALPLRSIEQPEPAALAYTAGGIQQFVVDRQPQLADTYTRPLPARTDERRMSLPPPLPEPTRESRWYHLTIDNAGSALLPVPLQVSTENGGSYHLKIPAQTWMRASDGKLALQLPLPVGEVLKGICIDPLWLTPDTDRTNNCIEIDPS
nr:M1 family aminopeptidase [Microbulbifer guangxiensis]